MNNLLASFEQQMFDGWEQRDFDLWLHHRLVYADWLEENDHALWRMARCPVRLHPCTVKTKGGPRVWLWRLYFDFPEQWSKPRPRWWGNLRTNFNQLLGFPPFTLRCKGWDSSSRSGKAGTLRFTVVFKPHASTRTVSNRRYGLSGSTERIVARDTDLHPDGFAAAFWTTQCGVIREITPHDLIRKTYERTLFDQEGVFLATVNSLGD